MSDIQKKIAEARERLQAKAKMLRWLPKEAGEEFIGRLTGKVEYDTKRFKNPLPFYQFEAVAGNGNFEGKEGIVQTPEEGIMVEVPAQGHLSWFLEKQYGGELGTYLILYTGKEATDAAEDNDGNDYFHTYQVERIGE